MPVSLAQSYEWHAFNLKIAVLKMCIINLRLFNEPFPTFVQWAPSDILFLEATGGRLFCICVGEYSLIQPVICMGFTPRP